jgi:hypothetical protein
MQTRLWVTQRVAERHKHRDENCTQLRAVEPLHMELRAERHKHRDENCMQLPVAEPLHVQLRAERHKHRDENCNVSSCVSFFMWELALRDSPPLFCRCRHVVEEVGHRVSLCLVQRKVLYVHPLHGPARNSIISRGCVMQCSA